MSKSKITYLFLDERKERVANDDYADDFFYGYKYLLKKGFDLSIIEMKNSNESNFKNLLKFIDRCLRKISHCSFFISEMISKENFKIFKQTDILVVTNDRLGYSSLPFLIFLRFKKKKIIMFVMGMVKLEYKNFITKYFTNLFMKLLIYTCNNLIFLSESEYEEAKSRCSNQKSKMQYIPFCIDTSFWSRENEYINNNKILFIGNDGNRNYGLVEKIANNLKDTSSTLVTRRIPESGLNKNVKLFRTSWKSNHISDKDLKKIYEEASLVFIPLKDSLQPSGQSVALQAMSMGVPVMISDTAGFWDRNNLIDKENILIVQSENVDDWCYKIQEILDNDTLLKNISEKAVTTVQKYYDKNNLFKKLGELID